MMRLFLCANDCTTGLRVYCNLQLINKAWLIHYCQFGHFVGSRRKKVNSAWLVVVPTSRLQSHVTCANQCC
jgi:hypothetical protein